MVLAGRRSGKRLQIGHQRRSNPRYHTALEYIDGLRACGQLTYVQGHWNRCRYLIARWKPSEALDAAALRKYGYETMDHLRNWRYYRKHSGGLIADLGSHQIDIFHWFLHAHPKAVMANGGAENYPRVEWYDHILAQYEWDYLFDGERRTVRGHWQACSTTGYLGYREAFLGTEGSLVISENTAVGGIWRHHEVPVASWERDYVLKVGPSGAVRCHQPIPAPVPPKTEHMPHLENFFAAIRDSRVKLNCPGEVGYETAVSVLRANEAVEAGRRLTFEPEDFAV
jgi:predicted dehydrogenase